MRLKLCLLLVFIISYSWGQSGSTKTFTSSGAFVVPAGVASINVQAWGGGGSGGGASGAPLLLGRGAAGGGGGAYASASVAVIPGSSLNVVVAGQTPGTNTNGTAGGNSTITGFESSILAAGGSGGASNSAGGTPSGGIGGTTAGSVGSVKFAGANGGNGNSWNLLGLLLSSGAGGNGANSGGAGGAAVSGLIFSNAVGSSGSSPGGAGSGAINSALGAPQAGGAGAAGIVVFSYTCPTYSVGNVSATGVCASVGSTSTVTVSSLPVGNYVVTYNRSNPSATGLTANLTVTSGGTGTFTAVGLTAIGSSTITITNLTSETCSSNITTNNTATVIVSPSSVGGTVTGGSTINPGGSSGFLTLSGQTGDVVIWQSSVSPFTTWNDISGTQGTVSIMINPINVTTQFRAVVQSGNCALAYSTPTTVTVIALPTITLAPSAIDVCVKTSGSGDVPTTLSYSATTGNPITYSIVWNSTPANSLPAVSNAALPVSPITISVPVGTAAGTYTGTLTVKDANGFVSSPGSVFTLKVYQDVSISTSGTVISVNASSNAQTSTLVYTATTGSPNKYAIDWASPLLPDQGVTSYSFSAFGGLLNNVQVPANVPAGTYTGTMLISSNTCSNTVPVSITINPAPLPTITLSATANDICSSSIAQTSSLSYSATTGSPTTYSIVWNSSPTNNFVNVTDTALPSSPITIAVPAGTAAGTYTGTLTVKNASGGVSTGSNFDIIVNESASIETDGIVSTTCESNTAQSSFLEYTSFDGNPISYSIDWSNTANAALLADVPETPYTFDASGGSIQIEIPSNLLQGTYSGILKIFTDSCETISSISLTVIPGAVGGTVTGGTTIGSGSTSGLLTLSGQTGTVVNWESSVSPFTEWTEIENTETTYTSGPLTETTQFRAVVRKGLCPFAYSEPTTVTVQNYPTITLEPGQNNFCVVNSNNVPASFFPLRYTAITGSPVTYSIFWDSSPENSLAPVTDAVLTSSPIYVAIAAGTNFGIYTGILTVKNAAGVSGIETVFTLNIERSPRITTAGTITSVTTSTSAQTTTLPYSDFSGNPVSYSIDWNSAANAASLLDQPTTSFTPTTGGGVINAIAIPANVQAGSYNGTLTLLGSGGCSTDYDVTIVINSVVIQPTITLASTTITICGSSSYNGQLPYTGTTGNPVTYSLVWSSSPPNSIPSVIDAILPASQINISVSLGTDDGTYQATLTVKDANGIVSDPVVITANVETTPNFQTDGDITSVTTSTSAQTTTLYYDTVFANPLGYSIDWDASANTALLQDQPFTAFDFSPGSGSINNIVVSANVPPGTYNGTLTVQGAYCGLNTKAVTITVNPGAAQPTITLTSSTIDICSFSSGNPRGLLPYSSTTENPTTYSIVWNSAPTNNLAQVTNEVLPADQITLGDTASTAEGTYTGTLTVKNANGVVSSPLIFTLNLGKIPVIDSSRKLTSVTSKTTSQTTTLPYAIVQSGNPVEYRIDWNDVANTALLQDQGSTPFTFYSTGGTIDNIAISANVPAGTYNGELILKGAATCEYSKSIFIIINASSGLVANDNTFEIVEASKSENQISITSANKVIKVETQEQKIDKVFVYDVSGNVIYQKDGVRNSRLIIDNVVTRSNQVLVVKVVLDNNEIKTKKIIY